MDFLFQSPPRPLQVWPEHPPPLPANFMRPDTRADKHFGQWCRNLSMDRHTQCPRGSPFHWYVCCGEGMAECCFGVQTWVLVMFGSLLAVLLAVLLFALWLGSPQEMAQKGDISGGTAPMMTPVTTEEGQRSPSPTKLEPPMP